MLLVIYAVRELICQVGQQISNFVRLFYLLRATVYTGTEIGLSNAERSGFAERACPSSLLLVSRAED
jgi:hypothetical protein